MADAIYKGVTILHTSSGPLLLATDFHNARIDVFDGQFQKSTDRRPDDETHGLVGQLIPTDPR